LLQGANAAFQGNEMATQLRAALAGTADSRAAALVAQIDSIVGVQGGRGRGFGGGGRGFGAPARPTFSTVNGAMVRQINTLENGDFAPNAAMLAEFNQSCKQLSTLASEWQKIASSDLAKGHVNGTLKVPACTP